MEGMPKHASSLSETMNLAGGDDTHVGGCRGLWESRGYVVFTQPRNNGEPAPVFRLPGKIDCTFFVSPRPDDRPVSCRGSHVFLKTSTCGITRHPAACAFASPCVPPRAPPPAAARGPTEGYFTRANPSAAVPGANPS
jgi:hypothetical protein